jgi:uncharacterized protein (TIGR02147 family)
MINPYEYLDYRQLLKDQYDYYKARQKGFSYRYIGERVGFTSAGFFTKILNGTANISQKTALSFAQMFRFTRHETRYFEQLVQYNQAKSYEEKKYHFEQLLALRRTKIQTLTPEQYDLFSHWYYVAIRELLDCMPSKGNPEELASKLIPSIKPKQAKKALQALRSLGLVKRKPSGIYQRTDAVIGTGEDWESMAIRTFQIETAELAADALRRIKPELREMSTLTVSISESAFESMKERLQSVRKELLEIAKNDSKADRVCQVNLQLFPLTKTDK